MPIANYRLLPTTDFYFCAHQLQMEELETEKKDYATIQLKPRGPVTITGNFEVILEDGTLLEKREKVSICRCGMSLKMPICDGAHKALASILG